MESTIKITLTTFLFALLSIPAFAVMTTIHQEQDAFQKMRSQLTIEQILDMDRSSIETTIDQKLSWKERGGLVLAKYKINRLLNKGYSTSEVEMMMRSGDFNFSIWGFVLGFFLPLLGILIAWLIWGRVGLKSAIFGSIFGIVLGWLGYRRIR